MRGLPPLSLEESLSVSPPRNWVQATLYHQVIHLMTQEEKLKPKAIRAQVLGLTANKWQLCGPPKYCPASLSLSLVIREMGMRGLRHRLSLRIHQRGEWRCSAHSRRCSQGHALLGGLSRPCLSFPGAVSLVWRELCVGPGGSSQLGSRACWKFWILEIPLSVPHPASLTADSRNPLARLWTAARARSGWLSISQAALRANFTWRRCFWLTGNQAESVNPQNMRG